MTNFIGDYKKQRLLTLAQITLPNNLRQVFKLVKIKKHINITTKKGIIVKSWKTIFLSAKDFQPRRGKIWRCDGDWQNHGDSGEVDMDQLFLLSSSTTAWESN